MKADGQPRFTTLDGKPIYHFMGTSTFSGVRGGGGQHLWCAGWVNTSSTAQRRRQEGGGLAMAPFAPMPMKFCHSAHWLHTRLQTIHIFRVHRVA